MSLFPMGSLVRLSSGRIGKVVHAHQDIFTSPIVSILKDETGQKLTYDNMYQLIYDYRIQILS